MYVAHKDIPALVVELQLTPPSVPPTKKKKKKKKQNIENYRDGHRNANKLELCQNIQCSLVSITLLIPFASPIKFKF